MPPHGMGRNFLYANLKGFYYPGKHTLIVGATGSGKTATLFKYVYNCWKGGDLCVIRDDSNLEFLSFADLLPLKIFVPTGCKLHYDHPNITYVEFDPSIEAIPALFDHFEQSSFNILLFDLFCIDHELMVKWWVQFFKDINRYKQIYPMPSWKLIIDEINDICPGANRTFVKSQRTLSSNVYYNMKKYRKVRLGLVGSTHNWNDLHKAVRNQFNYIILKNMRAEMAPERMWSYRYKLEKLPVNKVWILDESSRFQMDVKWTLKSLDHRAGNQDRVHPSKQRWVTLEPRKISPKFTGEITYDTEDSKMADKWKKRALLVSALAIQDGLFEDYKELATFLELDPSYMWKLIGPDKQRDLMVEVADLMNAKLGASTVNDPRIQAVAGARNIDDEIDDDIKTFDEADPDTTDWRREDLDA